MSMCRKCFFFIVFIIMFFSFSLTVCADEDILETVSGNDIIPGNDTAPGSDTTPGNDTASGNDKTPGNDNAPDIETDVDHVTIIEPLRIDSAHLYEGMAQTFGRGYIPQVEDGKAIIILPLIGQTYDNKVTVTTDLGLTTDNPFVFGNYSQTISASNGVYVFRFEILLEAKRINGVYPVTMKADYLNAEGNQMQQSFTVYVTIADGSDPSAQNTKEPVEKPKLFINSCEMNPELVRGEDVFTVTVTIDNIGAIRARSILLTYGSDTYGIVPYEINNVMHLDNIASGKNQTVSFDFRTTKDVPVGNQSFFVKLDYEDFYGGIYSETRSFLVQVSQPAEIKYDPIMVPAQVISGETFFIPVNVFNVGKSTLRNVTATISAPGLFPMASVFLGDIPSGQPGNGEMKVYAGRLSMTNGYTQDYGKSGGIFTITYTDDYGEIQKEEMEFSTEIIRPAVEAEEKVEKQQTVGQWWISILMAFAVISILVAIIVTTNLTRMVRMKMHI